MNPPKPLSDLTELLANLDIYRHEGVWAYDQKSDPVLPEGAIFQFHEREGWSLLRPATQDEPSDNRWVWIELTVHSDLHAVGFLAEIAKQLAQHEVPCNAIAGKHHDHLFIPEKLADRAILALEKLVTKR
ncbi:MAG: ACT domain-containing protein [Pseudomonadota bacterium]